MPNKKNTELSDFLDTDEFYDIKQKLLDEGIVKSNTDLEKIIEESEFDFELSDLSAQEGGMDFVYDKLIKPIGELLGVIQAEPEPQFDESVDCEDEPENPLCSSSESETTSMSDELKKFNENHPRWKNYVEDNINDQLENFINDLSENELNEFTTFVNNDDKEEVNNMLKKEIGFKIEDHTENANEDQQKELLLKEIKLVMAEIAAKNNAKGGDLSDTSEFNEEFNISDNATSETVQSKISSLLNEVFESASEN